MASKSPRYNTAETYGQKLSSAAGKASTNNLRNHNRLAFRLSLIVSLSFVILPVLYLQQHLLRTAHNDAAHQPVHETLKGFHQKPPPPLHAQPRRRPPRRSVKSANTIDEHNTNGGDDIYSSKKMNTPRSTQQQVKGPISETTRRRVLTAYLEPASDWASVHRKLPLQVRNTTAATLIQKEFPQVRAWCEHSRGTAALPPLPIDNYPEDDPYLPWLHDYFVSEDARYVRFVAQNRRRCNTGPEQLKNMSYWEPQVALLQPIPIVFEQLPRSPTSNHSNTTISFALDGKSKEVREEVATDYSYRIAVSHEEATHPETRFQCRFFNVATNEYRTTLSVYNFNYEYITWRKVRRLMLDRKGGKDTSMFWLSTLLFSCPIPNCWQDSVSFSTTSAGTLPPLYVDLVPIRTPVRTRWLFTADHVGLSDFESMKMFNLTENYGTNHVLPAIDDAGRWANIPLCPRPPEERLAVSVPATADETTGSSAALQEAGKRQAQLEPSVPQPLHSKATMTPKKPYQFVACTWTSASYTRRGDAIRISDSAARLTEWILFHLMVGVQHIYVYDNTDPSSASSQSNHTELWEVTKKFPADKVTYHSWPCKICNNNRPANSNPGERSSQYAAEASCRERYGPLAEWMTFLDVDEYLVPMFTQEPPAEGESVVDSEDMNTYQASYEHNWLPILDDMTAQNISILQFLSSRAKPRLEDMEELEDQSSCRGTSERENKKFPTTDRCVRPRKDKTFLDVYNCEYIRPPKPARFARARKQIFRTSYVLSHFVHYSTVTADVAETFHQFQKRPHLSGEKYQTKATGKTWEKSLPEKFADELKTGVLVHTRSILPHETRRRSSDCTLHSKGNCMIGYTCEDSVKFVDAKHKDNVFQNSDGSYCNCWRNHLITERLVPLLERRIHNHQKNVQIQGRLLSSPGR